MDKPEDRKEKSMPAGSKNTSTEFDYSNQPGPSGVKPNLPNPEHLIASESDSDDSPHTPTQKKISNLFCLGQRQAKRAIKNTMKKKGRHPLQHQTSEPKRKKKKKPKPLKLRLSKSLDESRPPASPRDKLVEYFRKMKITVQETIKLIRESLKNEDPVGPLVRPINFKVATVEDWDEYPNVSPFIRSARFNTHNQMMGIFETEYFELSVRKVPENKEILKQLGWCVKFHRNKCPWPGRQRRDWDSHDDCFPCRVICCQVCPHQFECNCTENYFDTRWCAHLHLAKRAQLEKYKGGAYLFISPSTINPTAHRHLRAFVQGVTKMWEVTPNLYLERFEYLERTHGYKVAKVKNRDTCVCPPSKVCKRCSACFCLWVCTCPDFWLYHQVCEHLHLVAMLKHENREELFGELGDYGKDDEFEKSQLKIGFTMQMDHEASYLIDKDEHIFEMTATQWNLLPYGRTVVFPYNIHKVEVNPDKDKLCICGNSEKATPDNYCTRCQICMYHYKCDCQEIKTRFICIHVHAVARNYPSIKEETVEDRRKFLEEASRSLDEILEIEVKKFNPRSPRGPMPGKDTDEYKGADLSQAVSDDVDEAGPSQAVQ